MVPGWCWFWMILAQSFQMAQNPTWKVNWNVSKNPSLHIYKLNNRYKQPVGSENVGLYQLGLWKNRPLTLAPFSWWIYGIFRGHSAPGIGHFNWVRQNTPPPQQRCLVLLMAEILHHLDVWNYIENGILYLSTGAGFLPSTVGFFILHVHEFLWCDQCSNCYTLRSFVFKFHGDARKRICLPGLVLAFLCWTYGKSHDVIIFLFFFCCFVVLLEKFTWSIVSLTTGTLKKIKRLGF